MGSTPLAQRGPAWGEVTQVPWPTTYLAFTSIKGVEKLFFSNSNSQAISIPRSHYGQLNPIFSHLGSRERNLNAGRTKCCRRTSARDNTFYWIEAVYHIGLNSNSWIPDHSGCVNHCYGLYFPWNFIDQKHAEWALGDPENHSTLQLDCRYWVVWQCIYDFKVSLRRGLLSVMCC